MSINAFSAFEITRLLVRKSFQAGKMTSIVLISSIASGFGAKGFCLYASTKGAIDSFVKSAAVELAPATRVNSVLPGAIETPMTAEMFRRPEIKARFDSCYPLGTGVPADVAKTVAFLLSDDSRWITGQNIILDGGRTSNVSA
jgi:NAD(P)-dependent dehydrogenase (short-subunit alcohol dehydrogenase family)